MQMHVEEEVILPHQYLLRRALWNYSLVEEPTGHPQLAVDDDFAVVLGVQHLPQQMMLLVERLESLQRTAYWKTHPSPRLAEAAELQHPR